MGSDKNLDPTAADWELPQHQVNLPGYWIGKTPVTVAQFQAFVQSTGYDWEGKDIEQGGEDHPVVFVTWSDAITYCNWLTETWRTSGQIQPNEFVQLPSEAEWEKAARGTDGRIYPWGNENPDENRSNFDRIIKKTTPVGTYSPLGDSPYGCVDMAGNVWEWTRSLKGDVISTKFLYPYDPDDGREKLNAGNDIFRVLRGGNFIQPAVNIRAACRFGASPMARDWRETYGFRIVVSKE